MKKFLKQTRFTIVGLAAIACMVLLGGCQVASAPNQIQNVPYSKGPTTPPGVKGPTEGLPQSATETDSIKLTLPEKL